jgi:hypothetical protein
LRNINHFYMHEVFAVAFAKLAAVGSRSSRSPGGVGLAAVEVLSLDNFVDGLVLANGVPRAHFVGLHCVDLSPGQAFNVVDSAAVTTQGVL